MQSVPGNALVRFDRGTGEILLSSRGGGGGSKRDETVRRLRPTVPRDPVSEKVGLLMEASSPTSATHRHRLSLVSRASRLDEEMCRLACAEKRRLLAAADVVRAREVLSRGAALVEGLRGGGETVAEEDLAELVAGTEERHTAAALMRATEVRLLCRNR
jgi:hypothetical protein